MAIFGKAGFKWTNSTLITACHKFGPVWQAGVSAYMEHFQHKVKEYAQENAPWTDQSGAAREGLDTSVDSEVLKWNLFLFHSVDYGIWLEIRYSGTYAIIMPTLEAMGPECLAGISMAGVLIGL